MGQQIIKIVTGLARDVPCRRLTAMALSVAASRRPMRFCDHLGWRYDHAGGHADGDLGKQLDRYQRDQPAAGAAQTIWTDTFQAADTATITPGIYRFQVFGTHGGKTVMLFDGLLN